MLGELTLKRTPKDCECDGGLIPELRHEVP